MFHSFVNAALTHLQIGLQKYGIYGIVKNATAQKACIAVTLHDRKRGAFRAVAFPWSSKRFQICCTFASRYVKVKEQHKVSKDNSLTCCMRLIVRKSNFFAGTVTAQTSLCICAVRSAYV